MSIDLQNPCIEIGQYGVPSDKGTKMIIDCGRLKVGQVYWVIGQKKPKMLNMKIAYS